MRISAFMNGAALVAVVFVLLFSVQVRPAIPQDAPPAGDDASAPTPASPDAGGTDAEGEAEVQAAVSKTIVAVNIEGNKRIASEAIALNITSKVGEPLSAATVREDIKKIYNMGSFEDVSAETEDVPGGVELIYVVKEKPVVADLRIVGNDDIKSDKILEVITVKEGRIIDLANVKKSQEAISELYSQNGLVGTEVTYSIEPEAEGTVSVTFEIKEGKKAYIKQVNFVGNEGLPTKVVKKGLYSKPKGMFSFISKKGLYNPQEIEGDSDRIRTTYIDNGYLDVKVSKPEIVYSDEKKGYIITFKIDEGKQYTVSDLSFAGDLIVPEEELLAILKLKSGEIFRGSLLAADIAALTTFYGDKGYAFANVEPGFRLDRQNLTVAVSFKIEKGIEVYVRQIDIIGNTRTRDKVIRREIPIQEGQLFNATAVEAIKPRVTRLGFFEENVEVASDRVPGKEDEIDLKVKVVEKPTGFFSVAGGFSSVETFIFAGQIQEANLFGYGKRITLNAQIGGVTQLFFVNYQDPHLFDTDWTMDILVFRTDRRFRDFDRKSWGGSLSFGRLLWRNLSGTLTYRIENVKIGDIDSDARLIITNSDRTISSVGAGLIWDSRNNFLDPSAGNLTRTDVEYAGGPFGGNTDFIKYGISSRQWFPLWWSTVFTIRGQYGIIDFSNNGNDLVVGERYFLGGPNSLRGYGFRRVGPRVPTADGDFVIIGGVQELLFSADYIFPIMPSVGLRGSLFFDMGNAFNDGQTPTLNPMDLKKDVGFGVRWVSPLGPLRLEIGFPLGDRLPGEDAYEIQFTVGTLF
ncbi:MAG: outer membrane protein assembly factor BamA [Candidatus Dadabacteria bacterium]